MAACFLADAQKTVLDHLVEMHHVFMTGLHRRAKHAFDAHHKQLGQRSPRNLGVVLDMLESLLDPERSIADIARELDVTLVRARRSPYAESFSASPAAARSTSCARVTIC
jgi:hypothetical protein